MTSPNRTFITPVAIVVRLPINSSNVLPADRSRMLLHPEDRVGQGIRVPYAPRQIEYVDLAGVYSTLTRPGLVDALLYNKPNIQKLSFTLLLTDKVLRGTGGQSNILIRVTDTINLFKLYARTGTKLRMAYSTMEAGSWRITNFGLTSLMRDPNSDEITQATADVELSQAVDSFVSTGPVTGGTAPPAAPTAPDPGAGGGGSSGSGSGGGGGQSGPVAGYHIVAAGETLWGIAMRWYNDGNKWTLIADANGIADPRSLKVGQKLFIPSLSGNVTRKLPGGGNTSKHT